MPFDTPGGGKNEQAGEHQVLEKRWRRAISRALLVSNSVTARENNLALSYKAEAQQIHTPPPHPPRREIKRDLGRCSERRARTFRAAQFFIAEVSK